MARALAAQVGRRVYAKQSGRAKSLVGRLVKRNGVTLEVRSVDGGVVTVHTVGQPDNVVAKHNLRQFLSKAVTVIEPEPREKKDVEGKGADDGDGAEAKD